jgi:putative transposase
MAPASLRLRTPRKTIHHYFRTWRKDGTWERIHAALRERLRVRLKRDPRPGAGVVDSQSIKSTGVGGQARGYDGGKKVKGRKRHLLVDTRGSVLEARRPQRQGDGPRGAQDAPPRSRRNLPAPPSPMAGRRIPRGGQGGGLGGEKTLGWSADLVERPKKPAPEEVQMRWAKEWEREGVSADWRELLPPRGFIVLPRRWVVERTIAWIDHNRRMSKDYERLPETGEAFIYVAMSRLMLRRLARS